MTNGYFTNKTVIVTGASSGIGKALALLLSEERANLALAARNVNRLENLALECNKNGGKAIVVPTDVGDEFQCKHLIQATVNEFNQIDMIINNAGIDVVSKLEDLPDLHLFKQVMDVNFYGTVYCTYYALPYLKKSKGRIVNISSLGGVLAIPFNTSYVASKFAVNGFSDSLRMELLHDDVSVTVICPFWVVTEFHENYLDKYGQRKGTSGRVIYKEGMMTAEKCGQIIIKAAYQRKREILFRPGKWGALAKQIAPKVVDKLIINVFLKPIIKRSSSTTNNQGT